MPYKDPIKKRECSKISIAKARQANPEKYRLIDRNYKEKNKEKINLKRRAWYYSQSGQESYKKYLPKAIEKIRERRKVVINHYGDKCVCCGESTYEFLTIDHINGGGTQERKTITATSLPAKIIKNNFPDIYQILCYNCNCAKAFTKDKICPHNKLN